MKIVVLSLLALLLFSCGTRIPYTDQIREEYALDAEQNIKKVQFYVSSTIILEQETSSGAQGTSSDGTLVSNRSSEKERIIIPVNTKCIFEKFGENDEVFIRFEVGDGKVLKFAVRQNQRSDKYYLVADWKPSKGGEITYGNKTYYATPESGSAYLMVVLKKLNKTRRKDRVVKGIKV